MSFHSPRLKIFTVMVVLALALDQMSKALAIANSRTLEGGLSVFPGFNLVLYSNTGVSFGLLGSTSPWMLITIAISISLWFSYLALRTTRGEEAAAFGLIVGGALGNIIDRVRLGGVTDFLDFYVGETHWPAFNLADTAIFCGVGLLLYTSFFQSSRVA